MRWPTKTQTPDRERLRAERRKRRVERARQISRVSVQVAKVPARAARTAALAPVVVVKRPVLAVRDVFAYWRAERVTLRQGMIALSVSAVGNLPTGLALGFMANRLEALPGLFILIPAAIGMRGAIFGALGSRLGTSIHAGLFRFSFDRKGVLYQNVY
ncbi:MAG TPA: hypothetical protein VJ922_07010, partial [Actinomycetota bacterium]|nr:hypothetical protein [Actinomycetota bacterium]